MHRQMRIWVTHLVVAHFQPILTRLEIYLYVCIPADIICHQAAGVVARAILAIVVGAIVFLHLVFSFNLVLRR